MRESRSPRGASAAWFGLCKACVPRRRAFRPRRIPPASDLRFRRPTLHGAGRGRRDDVQSGALPERRRDVHQVAGARRDPASGSTAGVTVPRAGSGDPAFRPLWEDRRVLGDRPMVGHGGIGAASLPWETGAPSTWPLRLLGPRVVPRRSRRCWVVPRRAWPRSPPARPFVERPRAGPFPPGRRSGRWRFHQNS